MAQPVAIKGPVQRFSFTEENTIGDLLATVKDLEKRGRTPLLRFVGLTTQEIQGIEILAESPRIELTPAGRDAIEEMGVAGAEDNGEVLLPDPALVAERNNVDRRWSRVQAETSVYFDGEWTTWGTLSQNEKMTVEFNEDGVLVGGCPI